MKGTINNETLETIKRDIKELEGKIAYAEQEKQYTCNRVKLMEVINECKEALKILKTKLKNF